MPVRSQVWEILVLPACCLWQLHGINHRSSWTARVSCNGRPVERDRTLEPKAVLMVVVMLTALPSASITTKWLVPWSSGGGAALASG